MLTKHGSCLTNRGLRLENTTDPKELSRSVNVSVASLPQFIIPFAQYIDRLWGNRMWLPKPVYDSLPYAYIAGGLLLIFGAVYNGAGAPLSSFYVSAGVIVFFSGVIRSMLHMQNRRQFHNPG